MLHTQYAAAGAHLSCPERYLGKAYVNNAEWDISGLGKCEQGIGCPVSATFTDEQFMVPMGCSNIGMQAALNAGRGSVNKIAPTEGAGFKGELQISDAIAGGADVYDVTVTLTCNVVERSQPVHPVRLSCVHDSQTSSCHMGRVEVWNQIAKHPDGHTEGSWGTVYHSLGDTNKIIVLLTAPVH